MTRSLFFLLCILAGAAAGWWWSQKPSLASVGKLFSQYTPANNTNSSASAPPRSDIQLAGQAVTRNDATPPSRSTPGDLAAFSYYDGIMKVAPAVVSLFASNSANNQATSQGSGVIVDTNGIVLTNFHLIDNLDLITVVLSNGRSYAAKLIGNDQETDLAVVKIDAQNLPFLRLDEAAPLRVGDVVLAIGNPFGVGQTVTQGIVSATRRKVAGGSVWQNFIQTDAAINPGNSGGALINPHGQLVGVNSAVFRGDSGAMGISYSIPADLLSQVVPQIIEHGSVARGWLGIGTEDITMYPALSKLNVRGAVVTEVLDNSPAKAGNLRVMDIVVRLGEQTIVDATQLLLEISALPPGATVKLSILRGAQSEPATESTQAARFEAMDLKVTLGQRPSLP